jgi:hypothetical protein
MALYQEPHYFTQSSHQNFSKLHPPGTVVPDSGIYRCEACGDEIAANKDQPLPPQNHHQHSPQHGKIQWRLIACAEQR